MNVYSLYRLSTGAKLLSAYSANEILTYLNGENPSEYYVDCNAIRSTASDFISKYSTKG